VICCTLEHNDDQVKLVLELWGVNWNSQYDEVWYSFVLYCIASVY
jgi:hypothetical protein